MSARVELEAAIEAILFASPEPVSRRRLVEVFEPRTTDEVKEAMESVVARFTLDGDARGIFVEEVAGGYRLVTRPELHGHLRAYFDISGQNRLSMAALETLAIVAYRQPVTGPEIQDLRGVNSSGVLKTLLDRRLIRIAGRKQVVGKPFIYKTTREFLMHFGLENLQDLPPLEEFEESFGGLEMEAGGDDEFEAEPFEPAKETGVNELDAGAVEPSEDAEAVEPEDTAVAGSESVEVVEPEGAEAVETERAQVPGFEGEPEVVELDLATESAEDELDGVS